MPCVQVLSLLSNPSLLEAGCTVNVKVTFFQHGRPTAPIPRRAVLPSILCGPLLCFPGLKSCLESQVKQLKASTFFFIAAD